MLKVRYENDAALLRLGSRKTFRISSRKLENLRDRRKADLELEAGEVYGAISSRDRDSDSDPVLIVPGSTPLESRVAIENE